jgi:hypothetical protein
VSVSAKEKVAIGITSALLVTGLVGAFQPPTGSPDEQRNQQSQREVENLSDAQERNHEQLRYDGQAADEADHAQRLVPVEPRPVEPRLPRLRIVP